MDPSYRSLLKPFHLSGSGASITALVKGVSAGRVHRDGRPDRLVETGFTIHLMGGDLVPCLLHWSRVGRGGVGLADNINRSSRWSSLHQFLLHLFVLPSESLYFLFVLLGNFFCLPLHLDHLFLERQQQHCLVSFGHERPKDVHCKLIKGKRNM